MLGVDRGERRLTLLATYAHALVVLKVGGGVYLLWLAWRAARSAAALGGAADAPAGTSPGT
ncbi:hypothetical protein GCM10008174_08610 [Methylopila turkensis]|uniref:Uncharacterized protein n=1 Tax=Methylopila turkensis TaxID=1437816 RepID=A0A9W6N679_9HYPH|nr:hypothetical protein GCM10008174_08610 [Methylopila turkensis]